MAIPNSRRVEPIDKLNSAGRRWFRKILRLAKVAAWFACLPAAPGLFAATNPPAPIHHAPPEAVFTARARRAFADARQRFLTQTNNADAAWQFGRACFDLAEWAIDSDERADLASQGINACRQL